MELRNPACAPAMKAHRMTHVFPRQILAPPKMAVASEGCYIIDSDGKKYLDASGGAAVSCLGHGDAEVIQAIKDQTERLAFAHTGFFTSQPAEDLADLLIQHAPQDWTASISSLADPRLSRPH